MTTNPTPSPRAESGQHPTPSGARPPRAFVLIGLMSVAGLIGVPMVGAALVGTVTAMEQQQSPQPAAADTSVRSVPISIVDGDQARPTTPETTTDTATPEAEIGTITPASAGTVELSSQGDEPSTERPDPGMEQDDSDHERHPGRTSGDRSRRSA